MLPSPAPVASLSVASSEVHAKHPPCSAGDLTFGRCFGTSLAPVVREGAKRERYFDLSNSPFDTSEAFRLSMRLHCVHPLCRRLIQHVAASLVRHGVGNRALGGVPSLR